MRRDILANIQKLKDKQPHVLGFQELQTYSVLLPLISIDEDIHLIFETRAQHLRRQPGEICFPGGRIEKEDENNQYAALREASEELRIHHENIKLIGPLDFFVSPTERIIYPYVAWINEELAHISPDPAEVGEIFTVPLSFLMRAEPKIYTIHFQVQPENDFPYHLIPDGKNYNWRERSMKEYFYFYEDKVIWGLTARILHEFIENIK